MTDKELEKTLKRLAELFYQQYIEDIKNGRIIYNKNFSNKMKGFSYEERR